VKFGRKNTPKCTIGRTEEVLANGNARFKQLNVEQTVKSLGGLRAENWETGKRVARKAVPSNNGKLN
jgi:hypothetical protein